MKMAHKIITGFIIALGLLHLAFTFHDYNRFTLDAVWFASAGIAMILAGFLNIAVIRDGGKDKVIWALCLIANSMFAVLFAVVSFIMPQPQVYFGILLFAAAAFLSSDWSDPSSHMSM